VPLPELEVIALRLADLDLDLECDLDIDLECDPDMDR
jgi:hypothetical protein